MSPTLRGVIGLVAGLLLGFAVSIGHSSWLARIPAILDPVGVVFVNAIRVAVIPLIVSNLIVAVAGGGDARKISRLGARAMALIVSAMAAAAVFASVVVPPFIARLNVDRSVIARLNQGAAREIAQVEAPSFARWLTDLVPANVFKAAADGALLPLIVVSIAFGLALTQVESARRRAVVQFLHGIADAFLVFVSYVVKLVPIGVFALAVPLAARMGTSAAAALVSYILVASAAVAAFTAFILYPAATFLGGVPPARFARAAAPAQAVAFSSRSSLAALPAAYEGVREGLALPEDICTLFLPLAASICKVGSPIVQITGVLFVARIYGHALDPWHLATIAVMAVATSLTAPGIPLGSIITVGPVLASVNLPLAGMGLLLAVDTIPDMFRTAANVTGWLSIGSILSRGAAAKPT